MITSMNGIISISVFIVFVIVFLSFFTLSSIFPIENAVMKNHPFFESSLESKNNIFLFGHSMVAQLNVTKINDVVTYENKNNLVYNMAFNADNPTKRLSYLDKFLNFKPTHVFYGISYDDFSTDFVEQKNKEILPDLELPFKQFIEKQNQEIGPLNPKAMTLDAIRTTFSFTGLFPHTSENKISLDNAPFSYFAEYQRLIHTDSLNLERYTSIEEIQNLEILYSNDNSNINDLKKIIKKLQQQNISVIIFLPPLHPTYLFNIQLDENEKFEKIISDIENEFNIPIYDLRDRYVELPIWMDVTHVAYNTDSMIYSEDITDMILSEIP